MKAMKKWVSECGLMELRLGDYREALADVDECQAVITDPPYSDQTHDGNENIPGGSVAIAYNSIDEKDVDEFCRILIPKCKGWFVAMTDDQLSLVWRDNLKRCGFYSFAPVSLIQHRPRFVGDGPGSCTVHIQVARPHTREFATWGSLPGWYKDNPAKQPGVNGAKPIKTMRALVRDYTKSGDLILDPCAGSGTTLLAAAIEGRRCIGSEIDQKTFDTAVRRISAGYNKSLI